MDKFIFFAFLAACLELTFQEYMQKDMIFEKYGMWLACLFLRKSWQRKLAMVLGYCRFCNGFWTAVGVYLLYYRSFNWWMILLFCGLNYLFLKLLSLIISKLMD